MAAKRPPALDRIDVKILAALQRDGRSTIQKLAHTVGLSPRASLERVRRLEASGVIAGYQAVVELGRLSRPVNVFAEIILERQANRGRFSKRPRLACRSWMISAKTLTGRDSRPSSTSA